MFALSLSLGLIASAQVPTSVNYQGRLVENGALVNGTKHIELRLYSSAAATLLLFAQTNQVLVVDGFYTVELGTSPVPPGTYPPAGANPQPLFGTLAEALAHSATDKVVEVRVEGETLLPLQPLTASPYALLAQRVAPNAVGVAGLSSAVAGPGLGGGGGSALAVNVDGSTLEISGDRLRVRAGGVSTNHLNLAALDARWVNREGDTMTGPLTVGVATNTLGTQLTVHGEVRITGGGPVPNAVLVSDAEGNASWRTLEEIALAAQSVAVVPAITTNLTELVIPGILPVSPVAMISGPGLSIARIAGSPDQSGNNQEFDLVFDYSGPQEAALEAWRVAGSGANGEFIIRQPGGAEAYRWGFTNFYLRASVAPADGPRRYTLRSANPANSTVEIARSSAAWPALTQRDIPGDTRVEITGIAAGLYPQASVDAQARTLTLYYGRHEGGFIWPWVRDVATRGSASVGLRTVSLIYEKYGGGAFSEIGRNNFFSCFPIRYQQIGGFDLDGNGLERLVLAYETAENADGSELPLYVPPPVGTFPAAGGEDLGQVPADNRCAVEIVGVFSSVNQPALDQPVVVQGPGIVIDRVPGFDAQGRPDDHSGLNREMPLVLDLPPAHVAAATAWREGYFNLLPAEHDRRAVSLIVTDGSFTSAQERYRLNLLEVVPVALESSSNGYTRLALHVDQPISAGDSRSAGPDMVMPIEFGTPPALYWGNASRNNPATDTEVTISGRLTGFYPAVTHDPAARTLTLDFVYGEGQNISDWVREVATQGTTGVGKSTLTTQPGSGSAVQYHGCFPLSWQLVSGFERSGKSRQRVVLSYDYHSP
jgi:hypothetical protein